MGALLWRARRMVGLVASRLRVCLIFCFQIPDQLIPDLQIHRFLKLYEYIQRSLLLINIERKNH